MASSDGCATIAEMAMVLLGFWLAVAEGLLALSIEACADGF